MHQRRPTNPSRLRQAIKFALEKRGHMVMESEPSSLDLVNIFGSKKYQISRKEFQKFMGKLYRGKLPL